MKVCSLLSLAVITIILYLPSYASEATDFPLQIKSDNGARELELRNIGRCEAKDVNINIFPPGANSATRLLGKGKYFQRIGAVKKGESVIVHYLKFVNADGLRMPKDYIPGQLYISVDYCGERSNTALFFPD